jgi:hypothetical protein
VASKRTLNATNLEALGAEALAALLIEVSSGNAVIQRRLRLALASAEGVEGAAQEVRKRLQAISRCTTTVDARRRKALITDLEMQLQAIIGPIAGSNPAQAFELLLRFLELSDDVLDRCWDSTGAVFAVFERAVQQLGPLAVAARIEAETLAQHADELLEENSHEQYDGLVPALKDALGDWGLKLLESYRRQRGIGDGAEVLRQIAVARGDVEGFLRQFDGEELRWRDTAASVAAQLLTWGRAEQALEILDGATEEPDDPQDSQWHDARIAVVDALGRHNEAQDMRWHWFSQTLSIPHLRDHLKHLDAYEDVEVEERALQLAEAFPDSLLGLQFLVEWPSLSRAARHVLAHEDEWEGDEHTVLTAGVERLSADHPLAATLLLRAMVFFVLWTKWAKRYRVTAEQLRSCEQLAARIHDWQGHRDHQAYRTWLQDCFETRQGFWKLLT